MIGVHGASAKEEHGMDVLTFIKDAHRGIVQTMRDLAETKGVRERRALLAAMDVGLKTHLELEKQYLYPEVVAAVPGLENQATKLVANGQVIKRKLTQINKLSLKPANQQSGFGPKFQGLMESVEQHFASCEDVVFPKIRSHIRTEEREDLGELFQDVIVDLASDLDKPPAKTKTTRKRA